MRLTKAQLQALFRVYLRGAGDLSFLQFRRTVQPTIGCDGAVVVHWAAMWLCIERDGYTHS